MTWRLRYLDSVYIFFFPLSLLEPCRQLEFIPDNVFQGYGLKNHVIRTIENINEDFCRVLCFMEYNCVSFNVKVTGGPRTSAICELNDSTHHANLGDLQTLENSVYHGITKVSVRIKYIRITGSKSLRATMGRVNENQVTLLLILFSESL